MFTCTVYRIEWKCYSRILNKNLAFLQYVTYDKQREDTWIRVKWHTSFRGHYHNPGYCHMWYVTFDGSACSSPMRIARYDYSATAGDCHRGEACELLKYITFYGFFQRLIFKKNYIRFKSHKISTKCCLTTCPYL